MVLIEVLMLLRVEGLISRVVHVVENLMVHLNPKLNGGRRNRIKSRRAEPDLSTFKPSGVNVLDELNCIIKAT